MQMIKETDLLVPTKMGELLLKVIGFKIKVVRNVIALLMEAAFMEKLGLRWFQKENLKEGGDIVTQHPYLLGTDIKFPLHRTLLKLFLVNSSV